MNEMPLTEWESPPETLQITNDEVHVWRAALDRLQPGVRALYQTLSADESGSREMLTNPAATARQRKDETEKA